MNIDVANEQQWNKLASASPYSTVFHDFMWGIFVTTHLGGKYTPLIVQDNERSWLLPCYAGKPWTNSAEEMRIGSIAYGGPLLVKQIMNPENEIKNIKSISKKLSEIYGVKKISLNLYPAKEWDGLSTKFHQHSTCKLKLSNNCESMFNNVFSGNVRTAIRKSEKENVLVRAIDPQDHEEIKRAHQLLVHTQLQIGSNYTTPLNLFAAMSSAELSTTRIKTFVAYRDKKIISTATLMYGRNDAFHLFHGWDRTTAKMCANQAIMWHMIKFSINHQISVFNMGESHGSDLLKAKLRWGGKLEFVPRLSLSF